MELNPNILYFINCACVYRQFLVTVAAMVKVFLYVFVNPYTTRSSINQSRIA